MKQAITQKCAQHRVHRTSAGRCPHFRGFWPQRRIRRLVVLSATHPALAGNASRWAFGLK